jgi:hypothetical protein
MTSSSQLKTKSKFNIQYFINQGPMGGDEKLTFPNGKKMYINCIIFKLKKLKLLK